MPWHNRTVVRRGLLLAACIAAVAAVVWWPTARHMQQALPANASPLDLAKLVESGNTAALDRLVKMAPDMTPKQRDRVVHWFSDVRVPVHTFMCVALEEGLESEHGKIVALCRVGAGPKTERYRRVVASYLSESETFETRSVAAKMAVLLQAREAVPMLIDMLSYDRNRDHARPMPPTRQAIASLGDLGDARALPALREFMVKVPATSEMARRCRAAIKKIEGKGAAPSANSELRRAIVRMPDKVVVDGKSLPVSRALPVLVQRIRSADPDARAEAVRGLARVGPWLLGTPQYREIRQAFDKAQDQGVRVAAFQVLMAAGGPEAGAILRLARQDRDREIRGLAKTVPPNAIAGLDLPGGQNLTHELSRWEKELEAKLRSDDIDDTLDALDEARDLRQKLKGSAIMADVARIFRDSKHVEVRKRALMALLAVEGKDAYPHYERALADPNSDIRYVANILSRSVGCKSWPDEDVFRGPLDPQRLDSAK